MMLLLKMSVYDDSLEGNAGSVTYCSEPEKLTRAGHNPPRIQSIVQQTRAR